MRYFYPYVLRLLSNVYKKLYPRFMFNFHRYTLYNYFQISMKNYELLVFATLVAPPLN